jgi:hypothetical protein
MTTVQIERHFDFTGKKLVVRIVLSLGHKTARKIKCPVYEIFEI